MSDLKKRLAALEARFATWMEEEALSQSERGHQLRELFRNDSWSDIIAMAVLAPPAGDVRYMNDEQRKCRVAALLVEAYKRHVAAQVKA